MTHAIPAFDERLWNAVPANEIVDALPLAIIVLDGEGHVLDANARTLSATRYTLEEIRKLAFTDLFVERGAIGSGRRTRPLPWDQARTTTLNLINRNGQETPFLVHVEPMRAGSDGLWVSSAVDVSDQQAAEDRLRYLAFTDPLTRMPNRRGLWNFLEDQEPNDGLLGLILVDIEDFSTINDFFGHEIGDEVLRRFATRLRDLIDPADFVARTAGDEFAVIAHADSEDAFRTYAESLSSGLNGTATVRGMPLRIATRIGLAAMPAAGASARDLSRAADVALGRAKQAGSGWIIFEDGMLDKVQERVRLDAQLRAALDRHEFEPLFQPIVDLADERIVGAEMLVRWMHPDRGTLLPGSFLGHAEETGLIVGIDTMMLRSAIDVLRDGDIDVPMNVNLSGVTLNADELWGKADGTARLLDEIDPGRVQIEVTESFIIADGSVAERRLHELAERGFSIYLDDFGTGFASLNYLQRLPIAGVKIDRVFTRAIEADSRERIITRGLIDLSKALDLGIVAEGIEDASQLDVLRTLNCPRGQGYLFSKPIPREAFAATLAAGRKEQTP
ncbi:MAG: EAL domain-containing protein [Pseudomonadota bacterium]